MQNNINLKAIKIRTGKPSSPEPAFLPSLLGNGVQIQIRSSTHTLKQEGLFYLPRCITLEITLPKRLPKVLWTKEAEVNLLSPQQVLAEQARYPYLTHLTLSSSDELLLSSSTAV